MIDLPPTEYLVMDLLAARYRTGEVAWTLPSRFVPQLRSLEAKGLLGWKHGVAEKTCLAWLTPAGIAEGFYDPYSSPLEGAAHSVWLHGKWRWLTQNMATNEREALWAAVKRHSHALVPADEPLTDENWAWWRDV